MWQYSVTVSVSSLSTLVFAGIHYFVDAMCLAARLTFVHVIHPPPRKPNCFLSPFFCLGLSFVFAWIDICVHLRHTVHGIFVWHIFFLSDASSFATWLLLLLSPKPKALVFLWLLPATFISLSPFSVCAFCVRYFESIFCLPFSPPARHQFAMEKVRSSSHREKKTNINYDDDILLLIESIVRCGDNGHKSDGEWQSNPRVTVCIFAVCTSYGWRRRARGETEE